MNTYQAILVIISSNIVPVICGSTITYLWLKYVKRWKAPSKFEKVNNRGVFQGTE